MRSDAIPSTLARPGAAPFWFAVLLTGAAAGVAAAALTRLLELVQRVVWGGTGTNLLEAAERAGAWHHVLVLLGAGVVTGAGQVILRQLSSGNGIDTTAAIWFYAGRMPAWRTLGSALLSVILVGMGVSLGREGAPKQAGAVFANFFCRSRALVGRATAPVGGLRRGGGDEPGLWRAFGRSALCPGSHAQDAGASVRPAGAFRIVGSGGGFLGRTARWAPPI